MTTTAVIPKPPYSGAFKIVNLDLNEPMNYLQEQIFSHAPYSESWADSTRRLINAIRADGERELRPTTIWLAYRRHKDLHYSINEITQNGPKPTH